MNNNKLTFVTEVKAATDFVELDQNEGRYELYIDFDEKVASVSWIHQSSYASMGMSEYEGRGKSFVLPAAVNAFSVKKFVEELDATPVFEGYKSEWDGSNWKGRWSDELGLFIDELTESIWDIEELEVSDWSENDDDNTIDFTSWEGIEITADTTDEELEAFQEQIESDRGDVIYVSVLSALTKLRDHLVEESEEA